MTPSERVERFRTSVSIVHPSGVSAAAPPRAAAEAQEAAYSAFLSACQVPGWGSVAYGALVAILGATGRPVAGGAWEPAYAHLAAVWRTRRAGR